MRPLPYAAIAASVALASSIAMWGFTVDDALIPVAYARQLAAGHGYRFTSHGPVSDGVTPLPWAPILALLVGHDALVGLARAKVLGIVAHVAGFAVLGRAVGRSAKPPAALASLFLAVLVFPIGAYAASGMETGVATALASVAAALVAARPRAAAVVAGITAAFRPEMIAWAAVLGAGACIVGVAERQLVARRIAIGAGLAIVPFFACIVLRVVAFGHAAPLAVLAKPSDLGHGFGYAAAAAVVTVLPLVVFAPFALRRAPATARVIAAAFVAHGVAVVLAGGDWMPWARLFVPALPSLALVVAAIADASKPWVAVARIGGGAVLAIVFALKNAPDGRAVMADRTELVLRARPILATATKVAALDVGWVSAATRADIVDLAGLTDASIAVLGGGHTSKRVDTTMLLDRGVDAVVVYGAPRVVEARLVRDPLFRKHFVKRDTVPFGSRGATYDLYRRRETLLEDDVSP